MSAGALARRPQTNLPQEEMNEQAPPLSDLTQHAIGSVLASSCQSVSTTNTNTLLPPASRLAFLKTLWTRWFFVRAERFCFYYLMYPLYWFYFLRFYFFWTVNSLFNSMTRTSYDLVFSLFFFFFFSFFYWSANFVLENVLFKCVGTGEH